MLHGEERSGEERTASKKNTVWGESSEFFVCGKFYVANGWAVGRNSLTQARMIICITFRDITFVEIICIIRAFELRWFQMVQ